jgi:hypothetical protein
VRDLVRDEGDEIRQELVQSRVGADRLQSGGAEADLLLVRVLVEDGGLDLVEVEDEFFGDDVLYRWPEGDVVVAC